MSQSFNHIAMSVPAGSLDEASCGEIAAFYADVFDWTVMPGMLEPGKQLVLRAGSNEQFVFVHASDSPMQGDELDHFGLSVSSPAELDGILARAEEWAARDGRVRIVPRKTDDFGVLHLHSFYVGFRLPLMVEVQCFEWLGGASKDSLPVP